MTTCTMKKTMRSLATLFLGILLFSSGCVINPTEQRMAMQREREDSLMLQEDLRRMKARLDALEMETQRLSQQVNTAGNEQARSVQSQMQGINASLEDLQRRIQAVDAAREGDKKQIVDNLSRKITEVMSKQASSSRGSPPSRRSVSNEGYEHTVQAGETLSAIAKAYGARSDDIIQANNLQSADMLRIGQVLFIPKP